MSSHDHLSGQNGISLEREALGGVQRIIEDLRVSGEQMGENRQLFDEELRRIASRLEVFRHESEADVQSSVPEHMLGAAYLFVPANEKPEDVQQEGLLAIEYINNGGRELSWRVVHGFEKAPRIFWSCELVDTERDVKTMAIVQSYLTHKQATPELVRAYLRHELENPDDVLSSMTPQRAVFASAESTTVLTRYKGKYFDFSEKINADEVEQLFWLPE